MTTEQLRPQIDLQTLSLVLPDDALEDGRLTGEQWRNMIMPPCPRCGTPIKADRVDVTYEGELARHYLFGRWECPNECDPRIAV